MGYKVAVVGATGTVGREMLNILAERRFPASEVVALASRKSLGTECGVGACAASGGTSCAAGSVEDSCAPGVPAAGKCPPP